MSLILSGIWYVLMLNVPLLAEMSIFFGGLFFLVFLAKDSAEAAIPLVLLVLAVLAKYRMKKTNQEP